MGVSAAGAKRLAVVASVLVAAVALADIAMLIALETGFSYSTTDLEGTAFDFTYTVTFATVGSLVAIKRPGNLVGWAMLLSGGGILIGGLLGFYAELALLAKPTAGLPLGLGAAAISQASWTHLMAGIFLLILLFPSGRVPSRLWRPIALLVLVGFAFVWFGLSTAPVGVGDIEFEPPFQDFDGNPLAFIGDEGAARAYFIPVFVTIALCLAAIVAAAIDLLFRFRRARGEEREQFKWLAFAAAMLGGSIPLSGTAGFGVLSGIADITFGLGLLGLPVAVGIAVLRYRLYAIDRILNRTLVYGLLSATLIAIYFGLVVGLQALLAPLSGGSDLAIALTTLAVAALFLPARGRIQGVVDRRFNRRSYDAALTVEAFSSRLREEIDLDTLRYEVLAVLEETMQPAGASVWLRRSSERPR